MVKRIFETAAPWAFVYATSWVCELMIATKLSKDMALAEYCSGSVEEFAKLMNSTAKSFGATNSNFVNPSGLPDENHYTTIYDMYLIFSNAISLESFVAIISSQFLRIMYAVKIFVVLAG